MKRIRKGATLIQVAPFFIFRIRFQAYALYGKGYGRAIRLKCPYTYYLFTFSPMLHFLNLIMEQSTLP